MASNSSQITLTLEFNVSILDRRIDAAELTEAIYTDAIQKVDEKDIVGVQIFPKKWPRKVQVLCAHIPAKECLMIQGLNIYGRHIELHEPGQGLIKVHIEDAPLDMPNDQIKDWILQYGTVVDFRNEHVFINGKRTSWRTGTRHAFIMNVKEALPPIAKFSHNNAEVTLSVWHYNQTHMKCWWCHDIVPKGHECDKKPRRRCHNCGGDDHIKADCTLGKICYKCRGSDHIARDCPNQASASSGVGLHDATKMEASSRPTPDVTKESPLDARVTNDNPGSSTDEVASDTNHKITMSAILIGGSNCRGLPMHGDDHVDFNIAPLIQGGLSIAEAPEKLEECNEETLRDAEAVIIHVGTCDFPFHDICEMDDSMNKYVELLSNVSTSCPNAQLIVSGLLPRMGKSKQPVNEQIIDFNKKLSKLAYTEQNVTFLDNTVHFKDHRGVIEGLYLQKDRTGIHINGDGKERLSASFQAALKEAMFKNRYEMEWARQEIPDQV